MRSKEPKKVEGNKEIQTTDKTFFRKSKNKERVNVGRSDRIWKRKK